MKLYLKIYCQDSTLRLFNKDVNKKDYSFFIVCVNFLTLLVYCGFLIFAGLAEDKTVDYFEKEKASPSDFALEFKNLPREVGEQEMIGKIYAHLQKLSEAEKLEGNPIIDVTVGQKNDTFILNKQISDCNDNLSYIYEDLKSKKYMKDKKLDQNLNMIQLTKIIKQIKKEKHKTEAKKMLDKLLLIAKEKKDAIEIKKEMAKEKKHIHKAYVTFQTVELKNFYLNSMKSSSCGRCCLKRKIRKLRQKKGGKYEEMEYDVRVLDGNVLKVELPPQPININWPNMTIGGKKKFFRRSLSWLLTLLLFLVCKF